MLINIFNFRCFELWELENLGVLFISCNKFVLILGIGKFLRREGFFGFFFGYIFVLLDVIELYFVVFYFVIMNFDFEEYVMTCLSSGISLSRVCV